MALHVDLQGLQSKDHGERGIARYILESNKAIWELEPDLVDVFLVNPNLAVPSSVEPFVATGRLVAEGTQPVRPGDVLHVASPFELQTPLEQLWPKSYRHGGVRLAVTLYDLIPLLQSDVYLQNKATALAYEARLQLVRAADVVMCISESTAADAVEHLRIPQERIRVVHAGVQPSFRPPRNHRDALTAARQAVPGLREQFVLYTGGIDPRKNMEGLLKAWAGVSPALRRGRQLVVVCRMTPAERADLRQKLARLGITDDVLLPGFIPDETLILLYQTTTLFVFPSLYEGFGLPVLEALACGAPVIAGDNSSLREIVPDAKALFDAADTAAVQERLTACLLDTQLREQFRTGTIPTHYTWPGVARGMATVLADLKTAAAGRAARRRARYALVSPLPPVESGVADYTARVLPELRARVSLDVFVEGAPEDRSADVYDIASFDARETALGGYDEVLYAVGNSEFHHRTMELLDRRGGIALLHDIRMTGLFGSVKPDQRAPLFARAVEAKDALDHLPSSRHAAIHRFDTLLVPEAVRSARMVLVHSRFAENLAVLGGLERHRLRRVTYGYPPVVDQSARVDDGRTTICSFGIVAETKQSTKLLEAFCLTARDRPDWRFRIIGHVDDSMRQAMVTRVRSFDVSNVEITGLVSSAEYAEALGACSLAVQLRDTTNGETSGAVADCLSHGVPVIVTALGAQRELRPAAVEFVDRGITAAELCTVIEGLVADSDKRAEMSVAAKALATSATPADAATDLTAALSEKR